MKKGVFTFYLKSHLKENRKVYFSFLMCVFVGVIVGVLTAISNESCLSIISSKNKVMFSYINGTLKFSSVFWSEFLNLSLPLFIFFLLGLNFFSSLLSFVYVIYQTAILVISAWALISLHGFSAIMILIFLIIPVNLFGFSLSAYFISLVFSRAVFARRASDFFAGFDGGYFARVGICFLISVLFALISTIVLMIVLKSAVFIIF